MKRKSKGSATLKNVEFDYFHLFYCSSWSRMLLRQIMQDNIEQGVIIFSYPTPPLPFAKGHSRYRAFE
jgi:hypothetical protein